MSDLNCNMVMGPGGGACYHLAGVVCDNCRWAQPFVYPVPGDIQSQPPWVAPTTTVTMLGPSLNTADLIAAATKPLEERIRALEAQVMKLQGIVIDALATAAPGRTRGKRR